MESDYLVMQAALNFLSQCEEKNQFIFGVERFIKEGDSFKPDIDGIADFSSLNPQKDVNRSINAAKIFMNDYGDDSDEFFVIVT